MSQVSAVTTAIGAAGTARPAVPTTRAQRALTQDVARAVKRLNDAEYAGQGQEITFSIDRATRLPVVKVVNSETREVLNQWPAQYVLQQAADDLERKRDS